MSPNRSARALRALWPLLLISSVAMADEAARLPDITVQDTAGDPDAVDRSAPDSAAPDVAALLGQAPGAAVNRNGSLTGIAQYRGLFGDRVNVLVDGMNIESACTNAMDTPLSHVVPGQLDTLKVLRGIAPVSAGIETLGGAVTATTRRGEFAKSDGTEAHLDSGMGGASVNDGFAADALGWVASPHHKGYASASYEGAADTRYAGGVISPSEYRRSHYAAGYGLRQSHHELSIDGSRDATGASGTPSLPMDILFADTDTGMVDYRYTGSRQRWHASVSRSVTEHAMTNDTLRTAPPGKSRRANTTSDGTGYRIDGSFDAVGGQLQVGADGYLAGHDAVIVDPNNAGFRVDNFRDVHRDLYSAFGEWNGAVGARSELQLGLRLTQVRMDAGSVNHLMYGMNAGVTTLEDRFNNADRRRVDRNVDWVIQTRHNLATDLGLVAGVARKTRSPSYQERYLWIPLESTGGLADGHLYVGDIALRPEVSHQAELGLEWNGARAWLSPHLFYRRVANYIQGTPATDPTVVMMASANGDPSPLQFSNVDATLVGADTRFGALIGQGWRVDGVLSYVRGKRDDVHDDLYRLSPLNGSLRLGYERTSWDVGAQARFAADQNRVSSTNGESHSGGYGVLDLSGHVQLKAQLSLRAGVSNVFDRNYAAHTTGINRVMNSDVAVGERVPEAGRGVFARLEMKF